MKCEEKIFEIYGRDPDGGVVFQPLSDLLIGAHSDHDLGMIMGLVIDKGIHTAFHLKKNGVIEMTSLQFLKRAQ